ncbi:CAP-Gly domain protein, partial [Necator americanus]
MAEVGDRVLIGGCGAVVRYVGNVEGHPGVWVGVEWDDPRRGKHDGLVNGVRYFTTRLQNIFAVANRFTSFRIPNLAENITSLDIGSNPIRCFSNISGNLNRLEKLSVADCNMEKIVLRDDQFPNLCILNIKDNLISEWSSINQLQKIPKLSVLYMDCENLNCVSGIDVHEVVIAKLSGLIDMNRFQVSSVERQSAEVRFLDKYFTVEEDLKNDHVGDIERLKKIHGTGAAATKSRGLDVLAMSICYEGKTVKRRLPLAITVQKLTEMVGRVFSVNEVNLKLKLDKGEYQVELDNPMRPLDFYSPEPDDVIPQASAEQELSCESYQAALKSDTAPRPSVELSCIWSVLKAMSSQSIVKPTPKHVYIHLIRCGVRLSAKNRTVCSAIMMMHRLLEREIGSIVCNYTLATTCLVLATKSEEDRDIGVRDAINASHRILHPDGDPAKLDDYMYEVRKGISELTFVVIRELNFDLSFGHPFDLLAAYIDILRSWMPNEFLQHPIADSCSTMLRDCYSNPDFVLSHSSSSLAIAVISLVLKGIDIDVPYSRDWYEVLHKSMTEQRLRKIE